MEGFLSTAAKNLSLYQADRLRENPDIGLKVAEIISTLTNYSERLLFPFKIIMDDPAGNSFIENPYLPNRDPHMTICYYYRSPEQDVMLGLQPDSYQIKLNQDSNFEALKNFGHDPTNMDSNPPTRLGRDEVIVALFHQSNLSLLSATFNTLGCFNSFSMSKLSRYG
jgi:zinc finger protein